MQLCVQAFGWRRATRMKDRWNCVEGSLWNDARAGVCFPATFFLSWILISKLHCRRQRVDCRLGAFEPDKDRDGRQAKTVKKQVMSFLNWKISQQNEHDQQKDEQGGVCGV